MTEQEKLEWLRLGMTENVGPVTFDRLCDQFGSPREALRHLGDLSRFGGRAKPLVPATEKQAEEQLRRAEKEGADILFKSDAAYPRLLRLINDAPPFLFVKGHTQLFAGKSVAIVGTRNASINGKSLARRFALDLAQAGFNIASGLARGIDRAAHEGALAAPQGGTIAVLGTPINEIYPAENKDLFTEIAERGALVSELPFGAPMLPQNFPRRNRIISGMSQAVLVIEAQMKSGSLITAREAVDQGRDVFAVPGSPADPRSSGPNALIKEGAIMACSAEDILNELTNTDTFKLAMSENSDFVPPLADIDLANARQVVPAALCAEPISIDMLIRDTGLSAQQVNIVLVELELAGRLERHRGNRVSLLYPMEEK